EQARARPQYPDPQARPLAPAPLRRSSRLNPPAATVPYPTRPIIGGTMRQAYAIVPIAAAALLAACASTSSAPEPAGDVAAAASTAQEAEVRLASASGSLVSGRLTLKPMGDGVHITGE